jgi:hypothetical protein
MVSRGKKGWQQGGCHTGGAHRIPSDPCKAVVCVLPCGLQVVGCSAKDPVGSGVACGLCGCACGKGRDRHRAPARCWTEVPIGTLWWLEGQPAAESTAVEEDRRDSEAGWTGQQCVLCLCRHRCGRLAVWSGWQRSSASVSWSRGAHPGAPARHEAVAIGADTSARRPLPHGCVIGGRGKVYKVRC